LTADLALVLGSALSSRFKPGIRSIDVQLDLVPVWIEEAPVGGVAS
jgi:hypothetical protein